MSRKLSSDSDVLIPSSSSSSISLLSSSPSSSAASCYVISSSSPASSTTESVDVALDDVCQSSSSSASPADDSPASSSSSSCSDSENNGSSCGSNLRVVSKCCCHLNSHNNCDVQSICWSSSAHNNCSSCFASVSSDGFLRIWDVKSSDPNKPVIDIKSVNYHYMNSKSSMLTSVDWSYFDSNLIIVSSDAGLIHGYDIRITDGSNPLFTIDAHHKKSINSIKFSPNTGSIFSSSSSDHSTKIWNYKSSAVNQINQHDVSHPNNSQKDKSTNLYQENFEDDHPVMSNNLNHNNSCDVSMSIKSNSTSDHHNHVMMRESFKHHSDDVNSFDFNSSIKNQVVDCSSDSLLFLYTIQT